MLPTKRSLTGLAMILLMALSANAQITVKVKVFLQGPYAGAGMMNFVAFASNNQG